MKVKRHGSGPWNIGDRFLLEDTEIGTVEFICTEQQDGKLLAGYASKGSAVLRVEGENGVLNFYAEGGID